jgi:hypothetical protein
MDALRIERVAHSVPTSSFRRSETMCGQGQDRTVDLPLFRIKDDRPGLTIPVRQAKLRVRY